MKAQETQSSAALSEEMGGLLATESRKDTHGETVGEEVLIHLLKQGDPEGLQLVKRKFHDSKHFRKIM